MTIPASHDPPSVKTKSIETKENIMQQQQQQVQESSNTSNIPLSFPFRERSVPVSYVSSVTPEQANMAVQSDIFVNWYKRCETPSLDKKKQIVIHSVEIQSVDMFGARGVGFVKIKSDCTLVDGETHHEHRLPGICFLRGNAVTILVTLYCDSGDVYSLVVDQPRVPIGQVSCLELPAGMLDDAQQTVKGIAVQEMEEECGIRIHPHDLIDLTELAFGSENNMMGGIPPSPGGCDERAKFLYLEKKVTLAELDAMRGRLTGLRSHGEFIMLKVVRLEDLWKTADAKALISLFLVDKLRIEGKLPPPGQLATPLATPTTHEQPALELNNGNTIPQLAFGLYKVPATVVGEEICAAAVKAGYRHFDTASIYENEATLGKALRASGIPRKDFFLCSKVWNDAVTNGRAAVRQSVEQSLANLDFGGYFDLFLVHWPVPDHFVDAYKELEELHKEGKLRAIGLSNFTIEDYEELVRQGITIPPAVNQFEVSPTMYRPKLVNYFQDRNIVVAASKALNRASCLDQDPIVAIAHKYSVTPAQVLLRWSLQKRLIVIAKSSTESRIIENRSILHFALSEEDVAALDSLTTEEQIRDREQLEIVRKR